MQLNFIIFFSYNITKVSEVGADQSDLEWEFPKCLV